MTRLPQRSLAEINRERSEFERKQLLIAIHSVPACNFAFARLSKFPHRIGVARLRHACQVRMRGCESPSRLAGVQQRHAQVALLQQIIRHKLRDPFDHANRAGEISLAQVDALQVA